MSAGSFAAPLGPRYRPDLGLESHRLENGLRLLLLPRPHLPMLSLSVLVRAGTVMEREGEDGLASCTAGLLTMGTTRRGAIRLAEDVDGLGALLGAYCDYDYAILGLNCLSRHLSEGMEIIAEILTGPAFEGGEVERRRNDLLSFFARKKDDPLYQVSRGFLSTLWGRHPYGHSREGRAETITRIGADEVRAFYGRHYRPDRATLALVGDFRPETALAEIRARLDGWSPPPVPESSPVAPVVEETYRAVPLQKDGLVQACVRLGGEACSRNSPDFAPVVLMNHILGGSGLKSRLMQSLREEKGLTYGVHSAVQVQRLSGSFFVDCQLSVENLREALEEILLQVRRMAEDGVTEEELAAARRFFTGSLPLSFQTNDQIATRLLEMDLFGLEEEFWHHDLERMIATGRDDVLSVCRRILRPERFVLVALGDFRPSGPPSLDLSELSRK